MVMGERQGWGWGLAVNNPDRSPTKKELMAIDHTVDRFAGIGLHVHEWGHLAIPLSASSMELTWDAPQSHGGSAIQHYAYRQQEATENWSAWSEPVAGGGSARGDTVDGLQGNTHYSFEVRAENAKGLARQRRCRRPRRRGPTSRQCLWASKPRRWWKTTRLGYAPIRHATQTANGKNTTSSPNRSDPRNLREVTHESV